MARNRVIGVANGLAWHIPEDFKYFKKTTLGKPHHHGPSHLMKRFSKPLPGRPNIVVSRSFSMNQSATARSSCIAIERCDDAGASEKLLKWRSEIFIIGGGQIYKQTLPITERLYLTIIDREYDGDTFFPDFDWNDWNVVSEDKREGDPAFTFYVLERK
jgi:dihydrofolate reductase